MSKQQKPGRVYSVELFPPKTAESRTALAATIQELAALKPAYFSVTFGAGGSTRQGTYETIQHLQQKKLAGAPHISCIDATRDGIRELLRQYINIGVNRLVALRGDLPPGMQHPGAFRYAYELVEFIRKETGNHFHIEVAGYPEFHPQALTPEQDIENLKRKIDAGGDAIITQYFYNLDAYDRFLEQCAAASIHVPIVPGVMPITNFKQLDRFSQMCGAEIPLWLRKRLLGFGDDAESLRAFGHDVTLALCEKLLERGVAGLHFYTLNKADATTALWRELKL